MRTIKLMIIDKEMNTCLIEINRLQFDSLGIDTTKLKNFESKRELNKEITKFLESGDK